MKAQFGQPTLILQIVPWISVLSKVAAFLCSRYSFGHLTDILHSRGQVNSTGNFHLQNLRGRLMVRSGQLRQNVFASLVVACCLAVMASAQIQNPMNLSAKLDPNPVKAGQTAKVTITAKIDPGWHLYSLTQPAGGPRWRRRETRATCDPRSLRDATRPCPR